MSESGITDDNDVLDAAVAWIKMLPYPAVIVAEAGHVLLANGAFQDLCAELDLPHDQFDLTTLVGSHGTPFPHLHSINELLPGQFTADLVAFGSSKKRWYLHGLRLDSIGGFSFCCLLTPDPPTVIVPMVLDSERQAESDGVQTAPTNFLSLDDFQRRYIKLVLDSTGGKVSGKSGAAEILDVNPQTLFSKLKRLGIKR